MAMQTPTKAVMGPTIHSAQIASSRKKFRKRAPPNNIKTAPTRIKKKSRLSIYSPPHMNFARLRVSLGRPAEACGPVTAGTTQVGRVFITDRKSMSVMRVTSRCEELAKEERQGKLCPILPAKARRKGWDTRARPHSVRQFK